MQKWFILIGREDLGRNEAGHWPATISGLTEAKSLTTERASIVGAAALGSYGASALAPCRIAFNLPRLDRLLHLGPPEFDKAWRYERPLRLDDDARGEEDPRRLPPALCMTILAAGCETQCSETHPTEVLARAESKTPRNSARRKVTPQAWTQLQKGGDIQGVYIGRGGHGVTPSLWANPYRIGKHGTREEVFAM